MRAIIQSANDVAAWNHADTGRDASVNVHINSQNGAGGAGGGESQLF